MLFYSEREIRDAAAVLCYSAGDAALHFIPIRRPIVSRAMLVATIVYVRPSGNARAIPHQYVLQVDSQSLCHELILVFSF